MDSKVQTGVTTDPERRPKKNQVGSPPNEGVLRCYNVEWPRMFVCVRYMRMIFASAALTLQRSAFRMYSNGLNPRLTVPEVGNGVLRL